MTASQSRPAQSCLPATDRIHYATAVAIALALGTVRPAFSQESATLPEEELGEVIVTGSRITGSVGMNTPNPVTAISAEDLAVASPVNITAGLLQLPQVVGASQTAENFGGLANSFFGGGGGGSVNLRGIGGNRTLVLLDSRRMPSANIFGGPDINTFPSQLMRRIETVTGGASAAYGTDAVSGVINYILDTDFSGFRAGAQFGVSDRGDGENSSYNLSVGHALSEKAHILFSVSRTVQNAINSTGGRDWYQGCGTILNPYVSAAERGTSLESPQFIPACNLHSSLNPLDGLLNPTNTGTLGRITFNRDGTAQIWDYGSLRDGNTPATGGFLQVGGSGQNVADELNVLLPEQKRNSAFLYTDYDITSTFNVYAQGVYSEQTLERMGSTTGIVGQFAAAPTYQFTIYPDNAYLPAELAARIPANGMTFWRMGTFEDLARNGKVANNSKMNAVTLGFSNTLGSDGFFNGWDLRGHAQTGMTKLDAVQMNGIRTDRIFHAVDAVRDANGIIRCRVTVVSGLLPDCQPLNLFGRGNASDSALDWVTGFDPGVAVNVQPYLGDGRSQLDDTYSYISDGHKHRLVSLKQHTAEVVASGKLHDGWGAGMISAAFGATWREESLAQNVQAAQGNPAVDPNLFPHWCNDTNVLLAVVPVHCATQISSGTRPAGAIGVRGIPAGLENFTTETQYGAVTFLRGKYDVKELFTETVVPLIADRPWMQRLTMQGAVRMASYSGSGTIWSWKGGLNAQLTDELRLRGTYSRDTRAANMAERFNATGTSGTATDRALPEQVGGYVVPTTAYAFNVYNVGSPDVKPERGDTFTVGFVYRPYWLPGLDMSVDWLKVDLKGAIALNSNQDIIDACYLRGDQDECSRIQRAVDPDGVTSRITNIYNDYRNLNRATFEGVDFELGYGRPVSIFGGNERVGVRVVGSLLLESSTTNSSGVKTENKGSAGAQTFEKRANLTFNYSNGPFRWNLAGRYLGGGRHSNNYNIYNSTLDRVQYNRANNWVGSSVYWDTRVSYGFEAGDARLEVFGNVQNLFDRDPPFIPPQGGIGHTSGAYDQIGRRYVMGVSVRF